MNINNIQPGFYRSLECTLLIKKEVEWRSNFNVRHRKLQQKASWHEMCKHHSLSPCRHRSTKVHLKCFLDNMGWCRTQRPCTALSNVTRMGKLFHLAGIFPFCRQTNDIYSAINWSHWNWKGNWLLWDFYCLSASIFFGRRLKGITKPKKLFPLICHVGTVSKNYAREVSWRASLFPWCLISKLLFVRHTWRRLKFFYLLSLNQDYVCTIFFVLDVEWRNREN